MQVECPYCPATFGDTERWSATDLLSDHITDAHQEHLPNIKVVGRPA